MFNTKRVLVSLIFVISFIATSFLNLAVAAENSSFMGIEDKQKYLPKYTRIIHFSEVEVIGAEVAFLYAVWTVAEILDCYNFLYFYISFRQFL